MPIYLVNAWDPRGQNIRLYENRYWEHIEPRHLVSVESIQRTLEKPDIITGDVDHNLRENYYARGLMPDAPRTFMKVVVEFKSDSGTVITAYECDRPKPEEVILWLDE